MPSHVCHPFVLSARYGRINRYLFTSQDGAESAYVFVIRLQKSEITMLPSSHLGKSEVMSTPSKIKLPAGTVPPSDAL